MDVTLLIPDDLARRLAGGGDLARRALEALAVEEYRAGRLTRPELCRLLGFDTRAELDGFLKARGIDEAMNPGRARARSSGPGSPWPLRPRCAPSPIPGRCTTWC